MKKMEPKVERDRRGGIYALRTDTVNKNRKEGKKEREREREKRFLQLGSVHYNVK